MQIAIETGQSRYTTTLLSTLFGLILNPKHLFLWPSLLLFGFRLTAGELQWENGQGFRRAKVDPVGAGKEGFTLLPPGNTRIDFTNVLSEQRTLSSEILPNGSGVAAGDVDGDSLCDLYFCGLDTGNRLYRNLGGWRFEDITERAGVGCTNLDATGTALVDVDGDGALDLIVNSVGGGTHVFFNDGKAHFTKAKEVLNAGHGAMSLAIADYDGDGWLDLYIANYRASTIADSDVRFNVRLIEGKLAVAGINNRPLTDPEWTNRFIFSLNDDGKGSVKFAKEELGEADALYRNTGKGHFQHVSWTQGGFLNEDGKPLASPPFDWGLSVMFHDLNGDGKPDLYVCNDFKTPDRIWINDGHGRFRAISRLAIRQLSFSSMGVDVADLDGDGFDELFACEMLSRDHRRRLMQKTTLKPEALPPGAIDNRPQYPRNTLFLHGADGTFAEIAQYAGLEASEWSWTPIFLDVDLDGRPDLLVANGFARDSMNVDALEASERASIGQPVSAAATFQRRRLFPRLATPNCAFRNLGNLRFAEISRAWGFDTAVISQGMCLADLDNDGDMDVAVNNFDSAGGIYRNDTSSPRIAIALKGLPHNTRGIGARIRVYDGPVPLQSQEMICGGRYLSSDQAMHVFAAGSLTNRLRIEVDWPSGKRSTITNAAANYLYEIDESNAVSLPGHVATTNAPFFEDASDLLSHRHQDELFDDFARQPALPKRLSPSGPGLCWCDLNGDGWDDLVVAGGKGGSTAAFFNDQKGGFQRSQIAGLNNVLKRDQTSIVVWPKASAAPKVLIGSANYEDLGTTKSASVLAYDFAAGTTSEAASDTEESVGPLALGDLAGDGTLALFVGGRVVPGKYPQPASSRILRDQKGKLLPDEENTKVLEHVGLVSGAVWSDLNGDGFPELILACEWGPLKIFRNDRGRLQPWNPSIVSTLDSRPSTFEQLTGWWNGVTTGDLDGDGRMDIIASNWGQNSKYQSHRAAPLRIYYNDFNNDGTLGLLETYFEPQIKRYVPERRLEAVAEAMPFLRGRFPTHQTFANAGVEEILGEHLPKTRYLEASCLESTVFLNRGDKWEMRTLPAEAQFAPAFGIAVADYDGDGLEDVFLSQNFFATGPETSRCDAGRGLWLKGDGKGGLRAVSGGESGVKVYGEQRGAAVADFDGDGRVDLVVTQNAAETRLFRNTRARPGLRVRLKGPEGNPFGYGAQLRLKHGDQFGPMREVHGGGGYWSQDSPVQVLGGAKAPAQIWFRWPGGKSFTMDIPAGAAEVQISGDGQLTQLR